MGVVLSSLKFKCRYSEIMKEAMILYLGQEPQLLYGNIITN